MLVACHGRVAHMLGLMQRLAAHLDAKGCDAEAAQAARDVTRYFDQAGPAHHEDEERHVFPALLAGGDAALVALVRRLQQDHLEMAQQWSAVRADLLGIVAGHWPPAAAGVHARWEAFAAHYRSHIEAEDGQAYPAAQALLGAVDQVEMGREMAQRRGVGR
jgi:hemerythrin-like domain-containing protein